MATEEDEDQQIEGQRSSGGRQAKVKPAKPLPTDRVGFDKQLVILRAYAKASAAADGQAVSNSDVAEYAHIHAGSVSTCNPFFSEIGLLSRDGLRNRPAQAVIEYDQAAEWNAEKAGAKLGALIEQSWFGQVMLRRLSLRPAMPKSSAIEILAEEARAGKDYRLSLEMLLEYLRVAGVVGYDGTTVQRGSRSEDGANSGGAGAPDGLNGGGELTKQLPPPPPPPLRNVERFSIPLPGKESVVIEMPTDMDSDDWVMLASMLAQYIRRWKKFKTPRDLEEATSGDE